MPVNIARAWIDPEYRAGLTAGQLASVRANPASAGELSDEELLRISAAGHAPIPCWSDGHWNTWSPE